MRKSWRFWRNEAGNGRVMIETRREGHEHKRTDWFVRHVYEKAGFFTPPYETVSSLKARLDGMYTDVDMGNLKSMAWFVCRKAG